MRRHAAILPLVLAAAAACDRDLPTERGSAGADIVPLAVVLTVQNLDDSGTGSLRALIEQAQSGHVINFAPGLEGGVIEVGSDFGFELQIRKSLTIQAPPGGITLRSSGDNRVLAVLGVHEAILENLIIEGGRGAGSSGGSVLSTESNLTLRNTIVRGGWSNNWGGGVANFGGTLTLENSTVSGSGFEDAVGAATQFGGGIYNARGSVLLVNSTVSGNTSRFDGGGIYNFEGHVTLLHATIADNGANRGGGIATNASEAFPASVVVRNSIVAANMSTATAGGPDVYVLADAVPHASIVVGHSLIGTGSGHAITADEGGNRIGVSPGFVLDGFGKALLADNGGPTPTHALQAGSPAIDAADGPSCMAAPVSGRDQRGVPRPQGAGCDMGAFEAQGAAPPPDPVVEALAIDTQGSVDRATGSAGVRGSITCSVPGAVPLEVVLAQEQKSRGVTVLVTATATVIVECEGTTAWAAGLTGSNGVFTNGKAEAGAAVVGVTGPAPQAAAIQLFWNR